MRKLLIILAVVFAFNICKAQSFDENSLLGEWSVESINGPLPYGIGSFSSLKFGESYGEIIDGRYSYPCAGLMYGLTDATPNKFDKYNYTWEDDEFEGIMDFFICNTNKLHIILNCRDGIAFQFTITELTNSRLSLKLASGTTVVLNKKESASTPSIKTDNQNTSSIYNLNGIKQTVIETPGIYIVNGEKTLIK